MSMTVMIVPVTTFFIFKVVISVAASLVYQMHQKPVMFNTMRTRVWKTERRLALAWRDARKMKTAVLTRLYGTLHERRAVCIRCPRDLEVLSNVQSSPLVESPVEPGKDDRLHPSRVSPLQRQPPLRLPGVCPHRVEHDGLLVQLIHQ